MSDYNNTHSNNTNDDLYDDDYITYEETNDYLKRAVQLNYRFIRIHPFVDSNGRTSRALLNMMTIPKGMLIEVPKERKNEFIKAQRESKNP